ncbi:Hydroxyacid oxidase [Geosmithia morbida]|uniref:Hydroxyacid oxidase n=1 Tax=Geosmithia morbida TaxID=1094350 RepID=A0A9P4YX19_9HYPO|nr:Hydroxyacid oxidase [Geosmithia morbida]KAF4123354.1 Hydroxyacid oxidase [Geosmithia morbida]
MEAYVDEEVLKRPGYHQGAVSEGHGRRYREDAPLFASRWDRECREPLFKSEVESVMKLIGTLELSQVHPGLASTSDVDNLVSSRDGHPYAK